MKYEKGKWYASHRHDMLSIYRFDYLDGQRLIYSEGYDQNGIRQFCFGGLKQSQIVGLATSSQIEQCLKAYAEKSGYVGSKIEVHNQIFEIFDNLKYCDETDRLLFFNGWLHICIYEKGKWADIVKEQEAEKDLPILCRTDDFGNYQLESLSVIIRDKSVTLKELVEVYQQHLDNKTIIG